MKQQHVVFTLRKLVQEHQALLQFTHCHFCARSPPRCEVTGLRLLHLSRILLQLLKFLGQVHIQLCGEGHQFLLQDTHIIEVGGGE